MFLLSIGIISIVMGIVLMRSVTEHINPTKKHNNTDDACDPKTSGTKMLPKH